MQTRFSRDELFSDHAYARPHTAAGHRLHGGFDAAGNYVPPRSLGRSQALANWQAQLEARGGALFPADSSLLTGPRVPNVEQYQLLLRNGFGEPFWNMLTITGKIEARGRLLADLPVPDLQAVIEEDITELAIGHLDAGLLAAHGIDEGGQPDLGIGGHDVMWFVARDLAFGPDAYPDIEPPESIGRPEAGQRFMPDLPPDVEGFLSLLMNLLLIEFRAEIGFANTQAVLRTPDLFAERRAEAEAAAVLVERIRTDELIHVASLCLYLGELQQVTFRGADGQRIAGRELLARFWSGLVHWATVDQPRLVAQAAHDDLRSRLTGNFPAAALSEFERLSDLAAA